MNNTTVDTVVHGGIVVSSSNTFESSVAIKGEKITAMGPLEMMPPADHYIDAAGKYVLPGAIDCHVHLREPDDWTVGSIAAAHAGLTTIIPFGLYEPERGESLSQAISRTKEEANSQSVVDFGLHFILTNDATALDGLPEAMKMGVTSFKLFMSYKKRRTRMSSDAQIAKTMEVAASLGGLVQLHCENGDVIDHLEDKAIAAGNVHPRSYPGTAPPWTEGEAVNRAILIGKMTECPTYVVHLSTESGLEQIKQAQSQGQRVWTETCPQYMLLDEEEMNRLGPYAKIGPPLRPADGVNQNAMWNGLERGYISAIGSDHAPHEKSRKEPGWQNVFTGPDDKPIPHGAPGIETIVPLVYSEGVAKRGLPIWWMARVMSENPARIFGLYPRKGIIQVGSDADLLIIDPTVERIIRAADLHGKSGYTAYEGWKVKGQPWMTMLRGRILLNEGRLEQQPGYGQFLHAGGPMPPIAGSVT